MKTRLFVAAVILLMMATVGYGQATVAGKWETAPPAAAPAPAPAAPAGDAPAGGGRGGRGGRGGGGQVVRLDLKVEGTKVTGSMFEGGADLVVMEGTVAGKQAKWHTIRQLNGADFRVNWTADMTDDNTISLGREFPNGVPGRGGAGAPPAAAPAAPAAAPPAGGAPPAGAPAAGGRGGRGGGGGAIAAVILKRVP